VVGDRERDARIAPDVARLDGGRRREHDEPLSLGADPHRDRVRAAVGQERGQMREGGGFNEPADFGIELHDASNSVSVSLGKRPSHGSFPKGSYYGVMQRTRFADMACSIARTLDVVGEPWSPLILRDVWVGIRRFDDIRADLGISSKVLAERLRWLVEQ